MPQNRLIFLPYLLPHSLPVKLPLIAVHDNLIAINGQAIFRTTMLVFVWSCLSMEALAQQYVSGAKKEFPIENLENQEQIDSFTFVAICCTIFMEHSNK